MDNFELPEGIENMGGGSSFYFTDVRNIATWPKAIDNKISTAITFVDNNEVFTGYATEDTLDFNENYNPDSLLHNCELAGKTPITGAAQTTTMRNMVGKHLICFFTDNNGLERIIGSPLNPAVFTYGNGTGQSGGASNGYSYRFNWADKAPCPVYDPVS